MKAPQSRARKNVRFFFRVIGLLAKGFGLVFLILLTLLAGGYYWLSRSVDASRARAVLEARLQEVLRRPARIQGVVLTPQGIKLRGVSIEEKDDSRHMMLESDFALVTVKIAPLFRRRLELKKVTLASPRIRLSRDSTGAWSFADLLASTQTTPVPVGRFSLPVSLAADDIVIERGHLTVDDRFRDSVIEVERFNLVVRDFNLAEAFTFEASFDNTSRFREREHKASFELEGSASLASLRWADAYVRASKLSVEADGSSLRGSAALSFAQPLTLDADLALPELGPAQWERILGKPYEFQLPRSRWKAKLLWRAPGVVSVPELSAEAGGAAAAAAGEVRWDGPEPLFEADLRFLKPFALEKAAGFRPSLSSMALGGVLEGSAKVSGWPGRLVAHEARLNATALNATFHYWSVSGAAASLTAEKDFTRAVLRVSSAAVSAFGSQFKELETTFTLLGRDLKVDSASAVWEGARVRAKVRVVDLSAPREVAVAGSIGHLRWEKAQEFVAGLTAAISTRTFSAEEEARKPWVEVFKYRMPRKFPDTVGHIRIGDVDHKNFSFKDTDILWDVRGIDPTLKKVSGEVRVGFGPGRVNDIQAVQASHKFLTIVFLPYIYMHKMNNLSVLSAATAYPKTLDFSRIEGQYGINHGDVNTRFSQVDSPQLKAYAEGSADFAKETVDMTILTRLTSYRAPLPEWWVDELGRPAIGFRVKGNLNQPELEPRLHKLQSEELEKALEKGKQRAREKFQGVELALEKLRGL